MKCQDIHGGMLDLRGTSHKKAEAHFASTIVTCLYSGGTPEVLECIFCFILFVESISGFLSFKTKRMHLEV